MFSGESKEKLTTVDVALKSAKQRGASFSNVSAKLSGFGKTSNRWRWHVAIASGLMEDIARFGL
jgi:hypothetical protein